MRYCKKRLNIAERYLGYQKRKLACERPFGALGRTKGLLCRLMQGQFALIPHLPLAECTMSPMLYKAKGVKGESVNVPMAPVTVISLHFKSTYI